MSLAVKQTQAIRSARASSAFAGSSARFVPLYLGLASIAALSLWWPQRRARAASSRVPGSMRILFVTGIFPPGEVRIRVNIFWSLSGTAVDSANAGQTPGEVISRAAKKLRELGVATGFVFSCASAPNSYLNNYSAAYPPRADAPLCLSI
jgi:hypothetical protein